jgi:hypothetical protein
MVYNGNYHQFSMIIGTQTKKSMMNSKIRKAEVTNRFQDGRRRHVRNSSACYKMRNYHPISTQIGTQTSKHMLSSKITEAVMYTNVEDGCRQYVGN